MVNELEFDIAIKEYEKIKKELEERFSIELNARKIMFAYDCERNVADKVLDFLKKEFEREGYKVLSENGKITIFRINEEEQIKKMRDIFRPH